MPRGFVMLSSIGSSSAFITFTMTDLILDLVGSLLVAIFGLFYHDKAIEKYDILIKMMKIDNEE